MQAFFSNMMPSSSQATGGPNDDVPWYLRYGAKMLGVVGGGAAIFLGLWAILSGVLTVSPMCIVAGIWQMLAGTALIAIEAPFCCFCLPFVQTFAGNLEGRPLWQKAVLYLILSLPPIIMCFGVTTLLGSGLVFATAAIYGMQVMGKKASRDDMVAAASGATGGQPSKSDGMTSGLTGNIYGQDVEAARVHSKVNNPYT